MVQQYSKLVWKDSWAWIHGVQLFIGIDLLSNLVILCLATYRSLRMGKRWIGDAFVTVSSSSLRHGIVVLMSWRVNEFWFLHEYSLSLGFNVAGWSSTSHFHSPIRASLLTVYLSICSLIGYWLKEKIDPTIAMICSFIGFDFRVEILAQLTRQIRASIVEYAVNAYAENTSPCVDGQDKISPMGFWTTHRLANRDFLYVLRCVMPICLSLAIVVFYVGLRKVHRYFYPPHVHVMSRTNGSARSENETAMVGQKRVLTLFEVAQLEDRYGLVCDFEASVFVRGVRHATSDGIYSTGYVIANNKYLLQTRDYWTIVLMKLLGRRIKNSYVYDIKGTTVEQTARLVYPHTLTYSDLINISVSVLS